MERYAIIGILAIVAISVLSVVYLDALTGAGAYDLNSPSYYGASKLYGGAIKRAMTGSTGAMGKKYQEAAFMQRELEYFYANSDKWVCTFGDEAMSSADPCMFNDNLQKYCCVVN